MVVISNMEHLPEVCSECPCFVDVNEYGETCVLSDSMFGHDGSAECRITQCPLREVVFVCQADREND